jgi:NAD(P)-dependent dehydrogenase (short-subunit alcohol dehydrogenase family)
MSSIPKDSVVKAIRQSPPVDLTQPYSLAWLKGKHIIVTGGASGFGEAFVKTWAQAGASIVVGDINVQKGDASVRVIRKETGNENVHFVACDVTDWQQQVALFKESARLSPHGGIDVVVANAGIAGTEPLMMPGNMEAAEPPKPNFKVIDVNVYGVLYTAQLAMYWLPKNPQSKPCSPNSDPATTTRDRCLLLVGSMASLGPIPTQPLYGTAKHAVLGLFRTMRASSFVDGVRVTMINPYFIETPIVPTIGRLLMAGGAIGKVEDVVDAASRLVADSRILGRALCIGPKVRVIQHEDGEFDVVPRSSAQGTDNAIWEVYADDFEDAEIFGSRMIGILKGAAALKGWAGMINDIVGAFKYALFG